MINKLLLFSSVLFLLSCSCKKKIQSVDSTTKEETNIVLVANDSLILNSTKEFGLKIEKKSNRKNDLFPTLFYSVVDLNSNKIVYKDVIPGGKVKWISNYILELKSLVGRPKDIYASKQKVLYKLNVKTLTKFK